jgi:hypothetical protein
LSAIDKALSKLSADMQAAGASQNKWYLAQLAAQDAANTSGEPMDVLLNQAYERLGLPSTLAKSSRVNPSNPSSMAAEYSALSNLEGGVGSGSRGGREGGISGQMSAADRATLGSIADVTSVLGGLGVPGVGVLGTGLKGALGIDSALAALGLAETPDLIGLTEADFADIGAQRGAFAESAARSANAAEQSSFADANKSVGMLGLSESQLDSAREAAARAAEPGTENPSSDMKDGSTTEGGDDGTGTGTAGGSGGDGSTGGNVAKRGGVFKASGKRAKKLTWGEPGTGGETLVAIPETMKQFGKQPNEDRIIAALEQLLAELKGKE